MYVHYSYIRIFYIYFYRAKKKRFKSSEEILKILISYKVIFVRIFNELENNECNNVVFHTIGENFREN